MQQKLYNIIGNHKIILLINACNSERYYLINDGHNKLVNVKDYFGSVKFWSHHKTILRH